MNAKQTLGIVVGLLVVAPSLASANVPHEGAKCTLSMTKHYTPSPWTEQARYIDQAKQKFIFGGKNTLLGFTELYTEPREAMRAQEGFMRGMGRGMVNMLGDTLGGAVHLVTFPITCMDVPLPEGGTDVL